MTLADFENGWLVDNFWPLMACGCNICMRRCEGTASQWFVVTDEECEKLVAAAEENHAHAVLCILKRQPWWTDMVAGVRAMRHLKPGNYIKISERPEEW